jgi:two-component system, LytTR family, sensor histidine kinase AlgZ
MKELMKKINAFFGNEFIFSPRYRLSRHLLYWLFHTIIWFVFWTLMLPEINTGQLVLNLFLWIPVLILFSYVLAYGAIPRLLLKGKVWQSVLLILGWAFAGIYLNYGYRIYIFVPIQEAMGLQQVYYNDHQPYSYLCVYTSSASPIIIRFFKLWTWKQRDWLREQKEKITVELQLLKAQVHPHFLFNTLNNIYSFSLDKSLKTPGLILKLSSLLRYMIYDCKAEQVRLEKELEIMKNYIDLEKERYDNRIEISWNVEGEVRDKFISPLLMLPFLENAFKHGASEQLVKPWLKVDISVMCDVLECKIINSKNELALPGNNHNYKGIGINNVKKRLEFLYPGKHELKINDSGDSFAVFLMVSLDEAQVSSTPPHLSIAAVQSVTA